MADEKELDIKIQVEAGSVALVFNQPEDPLRIPMSPELANELGYELIEFAQSASEMNSRRT